MVYDFRLAARIESFAEQNPFLQKKKMFGGIGYLFNGNMAFGILGDDLIVRIGLDQYEEALQQPFTKLFDTRGRPMRGWVMVTPAGTEEDQGLVDWLQKGIQFTSTLPPKG